MRPVPFYALLSLLALLFGWLGWIGGAINPFDRDLVANLFAHRHDHPLVAQAAIWLTQVGSAWVTLTSAALGSTWQWWRGQRQLALALAATVAGGRLLSDGFKLLYDRPRPSIDLHPVATTSSSFPSGHAANSMVAFVALALFLSPPRLRRPMVIVAVALSIAIALTRPYLGVHWPTDIAGGWILAAMVLLVSVRLARGTLGPVKEQHQVVGRHPPTLDQH